MKVALLRGINVGGSHKVPMADLRRLIESIGGGDVATYIQSGNAVASGEFTGEQLADAIDTEFGFRPSTLVLDGDEFRRIVDECPYDLAGRKAVHVFFGLEPLSADLDGARELATATEQVAATDRAVYLYAPDGIGRSKLAERLHRFVDAELTARNGNTINKLLAMLDEPAG